MILILFVVACSPKCGNCVCNTKAKKQNKKETAKVSNVMWLSNNWSYYTMCYFLLPFCNWIWSYCLVFVFCCFGFVRCLVPSHCLSCGRKKRKQNKGENTNNVLWLDDVTCMLFVCCWVFKWISNQCCMRSGWSIKTRKNWNREKLSRMWSILCDVVLMYCVRSLSIFG